MMDEIITDTPLSSFIPSRFPFFVCSFSILLSRSLSLSEFRSCRNFDAYIMLVVSETLWQAERLQNAIFHHSRLSSLLRHTRQTAAMSALLVSCMWNKPDSPRTFKEKVMRCHCADCNFERNKAVLVEPRNKLP